MGTLRVRNLAQKVLWEQELTGQLSDGNWENARPYDHWEPWCDADCVVDPDNVGRDFYAQRDSYGFNRSDLLEIIGERMVEYVRVATGDTSYDSRALRKDLRDLGQIIKLWALKAPPIPPQPVGRRAKLVIDGYPQEFTVYHDVADDPKAVEVFAERERQSAEYRVERLEEKFAEARAALAKVEAELEEARAAIGMLHLT